MATNLRDIIKSEYKKCVKVPSYFMRKFCLIQHPIRGKVHFNLYDFQEETLDQFTNNRYNIILKARQLGMSTLVAGYSLWLMLFNDDKNILVIATKQETAKNLVTKIRVMHQNLPIWLRGKCTEDNKTSLKFENGSQVKAISSSPDAGRSEALSLLILDECAFIDDVDTIWKAASSTISTGGDAILLSTPNGMGNFFHKTWKESVEGEGDFNPIFLDWTAHPERDQDWRDDQTRILGPIGARQEHDADFIASGNTVIDGDLIQYYRKTFEKDPLYKRGIDSNLWIWEEADYSRTYVVCADVARGDGRDSSAFHVIDVESVTQVAEYRGKVGTKDFGNMLVAIATEYNDALLIIENSNIGWATIQEVLDRGYKNLFYMIEDMKYLDDARHTNKHYAEEKKKVAGFTTSARTRPLIISKLDEYMKDHSVIIQSSRTLGELEVFVWKASRPEAENGYNDDLVISLCIGLWVRDTALQLRQRGIEIMKTALDNIAVKHPDEIVYKAKHIQYDPYEMPIREGQPPERLDWLLG